MEERDLASPRAPRPGPRRAVVAGLVAALVIVAVPVLTRLGSDSSGGTGRGTKGESLIAVRAAVANTVASGSYENDFDTHSTHPNSPGPQLCPPNAMCSAPASTWTFESSGHGITNFDPYIQRSVVDSSYGPRTLYVTSTTVWMASGTGPVGPGTPLSEFANAVESALGPSPGALAMIRLASPGGPLNLEEAAMADAAPAGTGTVGGATVTYYDVTIDMTKLADTPDLSDVERETIQAALPLLEQGGYSGTTERVGVDDGGYIREVTGTDHYTDGSTATQHTVLSNFGCAPKVSPPDPGSGAAPVGPAVPCPAPDVPATTGPVSTTSTSVPASTTIAPASTSDTDAIRALFVGWINAENVDASAAFIEDYSSIADAIRQGIAQHSPADLAKFSARVDSVQLVDATHADVVYTVLYSGSPLYAEQQGQAVKIDGRWKVSRDTVCALLTHGGITCPPVTTTTTGR